MWAFNKAPNDIFNNTPKLFSNKASNGVFNVGL